MSSAGLAIGALVVFGIGSSCAGTLGNVIELAVKDIDKEQFPIIRTIGEVFSKTIQSASAGFALLLTASLFLTPPVGAVLGVGILGIGVVMLLTPMVNGIIQRTNTESLKKAFALADQIVNVTSKTVNTAILTAGITINFGIPLGVAAGIGLGALSIVTYIKK